MARSRARPATLATTGIGSLPHRELEAALAAALSSELPYLPEMPRRSAAESMAARAAERLPGFTASENRGIAFDGAAWQAGAPELDARLDAGRDGGVVEPFAPPAECCQAWPRFIEEIARRRPALAKAQCSGPATVRALLTACGALPVRLEERIGELVLCRARAMARAIRWAGATPIVFLDEPLLCSGAAWWLEAVRLIAAGVRGEGGWIGLHCCNDADWPLLLRLDLDVVSFDASLSLDRVLLARPDLERFLEAGGWLGLGVVPTDAMSSDELEKRLEATLRSIESIPEGLRSRLLAQCLLTPACGLGARTEPHARQVLSALDRAHRALSSIGRAGGL